MKSADFFYVEEFDEINFTGKSFVKAEKNNHHELSGELDMKGKKKKVKLDVEFGGIIKDPWGTEKASFSLSAKINRKDWDLNWNTPLETGGVLVSEDVWINCEVLLMKES